MDGESEGGRGWRLAELGGGGALLAISAVFGYLAAPEYQSTAYAIGAAFGSILGGLLLAAAGRWAWVRFGPGSPPVMAPAIVLVAGVIAFLLALASLGREAQESDAVIEESIAHVESSAVSCADPLPGRIGDGLVLGPLPPGLKRRVESAAVLAGPAAELFEFASYEQALRDGRFAGLLTLVPLEGAGDASNAEELLAGAEDGVAAQGGDPTRTTVAGRPAVAFEAGPESVIVTALDCHALFVNALAADDAREVATAAVEAQR